MGTLTKEQQELFCKAEVAASELMTALYAVRMMLPPAIENLDLNQPRFVLLAAQDNCNRIIEKIKKAKQSV